MASDKPTADPGPDPQKKDLRLFIVNPGDLRPAKPRATSAGPAAPTNLNGTRAPTTSATPAAGGKDSAATPAAAQALAAAEREIEKARAQLSADRAALESQVQAAAAERKALVETRRALESDRALLEQDKRRLAQRRVDLDAERAILEADRKTLINNRAAIDADRRRAAEDLAAAKVGIEKLQVQRDELQTTRGELTARQSELAVRQAELEKLKGELAARDAELSRQGEQLMAERQSGQSRLSAEQQAVNQERESVSQDRQALERQRAELAGEQQKLGEQLARFKAELESIAAREKRVEAERQAAEDRQKSAREDHGKQESSLQVRESRLKEQQAELERSRAQQQSLQREIEERRRQLEAQAQSHAIRVAEFNEQVAREMKKLERSPESQGEKKSAAGKPGATPAAQSAKESPRPKGFVAEAMRKTDQPPSRSSNRKPDSQAIASASDDDRRELLADRAADTRQVAAAEGHKPKAPLLKVAALVLAGGAVVAALVLLFGPGQAGREPAADPRDTQPAAVSSTDDTIAAAAPQDSALPATSATMIAGAETPADPVRSSRPLPKSSANGQSTSVRPLPGQTAKPRGGENAPAATTAKSSVRDPSAIPGGLWPYKAPENLVPGELAKELAATLDWAGKELAATISKVRESYKMSDPQRAIAMQPEERLRRDLAQLSGLPYVPEQVVDSTGQPQDETIKALIFLQFVYEGSPHLMVLKQREDGSVVTGRRGSFVLVPGTIQEHTVILDPEGAAVPEPMAP